MIEFLEEYALLIAVALPATIVVAINVYLVLAGERGTLLLPSDGPFPDVHPHAGMLPDREACAEAQAMAEDDAAMREAA